MKSVGIVGYHGKYGAELNRVLSFLGIETYSLPDHADKIDQIDAIIITPENSFIDELILYYKRYNLPVYISSDYFVYRGYR